MKNPSPRPNAAFASVSALFFAWGFITATIDPLVPSVRAVFALSYAESMLTQFAFFMAYGLVSLPAAMIVARAGASRSILIALGCMALGCLIVPLATNAKIYGGVLLALFVIASGVTLLQVAANPLAAAAGPPERSHFRLTLAQAFNSLGTVIAPYLGAALLLSGGVFAAQASANASAESLAKIDIAFLAIGGCIVLLAVHIWRSRISIDSAAPPAPFDLAVLGHSLRSRWTLFGALAIFLYVGAEVSIGSVMINFLEGPTVLNLTPEKAGRLLSLYWLGALVGRFVGSYLLTRIRAEKLLLAATIIAGLLCLTVVLTSGAPPAIAALSIGLFNSIMFPTIFTLTLERSSAPPSATAGVLCVAIVGGAVLPFLVGHAADRFGLALAFAIPMLAYFGVSLFALFAARVPTFDHGVQTPRSGH